MLLGVEPGPRANHTTLEVGPPRRMCWAGATLLRARAVSAGKGAGGGVLGSGDTGAAWSRPSRAAAGEQRTAAIARARPAPTRPPFVPVGSRPFGAGPVLCCCRGSIWQSWVAMGSTPFCWLRRMAFLFDRVLWKAEAFAPICREEYRRSLRLFKKISTVPVTSNCLTHA